MKNTDFVPGESEGCLESELTFTRTHSAAMRLESLHTIARSILNRNGSWTIRLLTEIENHIAVLDQIGLVVSKTYAHRGDRYQLTDDKALILIRDLLLQHGPFFVIRIKEQRVCLQNEIIRKHRNARLSKLQDDES